MYSPQTPYQLYQPVMCGDLVMNRCRTMPPDHTTALFKWLTSLGRPVMNVWSNIFCALALGKVSFSTSPLYNGRQPTFSVTYSERSSM